MNKLSKCYCWVRADLCMCKGHFVLGLMDMNERAEAGCIDPVAVVCETQPLSEIARKSPGS